jgi:hypothetical protein
MSDVIYFLDVISIYGYQTGNTIKKSRRMLSGIFLLVSCNLFIKQLCKLFHSSE